MCRIIVTVLNYKHSGFSYLETLIRPFVKVFYGFLCFCDLPHEPLAEEDSFEAFLDEIDSGRIRYPISDILDFSTVLLFFIIYF